MAEGEIFDDAEGLAGCVSVFGGKPIWRRCHLKVLREDDGHARWFKGWTDLMRGCCAPSSVLGREYVLCHLITGTRLLKEYDFEGSQCHTE